MSASIMTSQEFKRHRRRAKQLAKNGPVTITERGKPAYTFMTYLEYEAQTQAERANRSDAPRSA